MIAMLNDTVIDVLENLGLSEKPFDQEGIINLLKNPLNQAWVTVYAHHSDLENEPSVFACFADKELKESILQGDDWIKHADSFQPGFWIGNGETHYTTGKDDGYDFIVAELYFHPYEQAQIHINQEFVLLFELYKGNNGCYYSIDECGEKEKVVDIQNDTVRVRTKYILRYIAAKQCLFVYFIDSRFASAKRYPMHAELIDDDEEIGSNYHFKRWFQATSDKSYLLSMLYSRSFIEPGAQDGCNIWPYEREDEFYPNYIIGENPDGSPVEFTCDPDRLGTYFDEEKTAPHYLTPVYFKPSVLDKYRTNPLFTVTDRRMTCGSQWSIEIDNVDPDRVMVFLGDLGRDLPESERQHFLSFQTSPVDHHISEEVFLNDFMNMFTEPSGPISKLLEARRALDEAWRVKFGSLLYRPFHKKDYAVLQQIRIPSGNGEPEFESVVMALAKTFIDYIDESNFKEYDEKGSINKLDAFLRSKNLTIDLQPLRNIQSIRSNGAAHSKGKNYDKLQNKIVTEDHRTDALNLISNLTDLINAITCELRQ